MKKLSTNFFVFGLSIMVFILLPSCLSKKIDKDTHSFRYEIEPVATGAQGTYMIKVWTYSKNPTLAIDQAKKNAVHGVIFKGFAAKDRVPGQRPLAPNMNLEKEREDFFKPFFDKGGSYLRYVNITGDGSVRAEDRLRVGDEYKIGVVVSVNVAQLRKDLEDAGIIRSLGSGF